MEMVHLADALDDIGSPTSCDTGNEYDGRMRLRISSTFVILFGSVFGAIFPIVVKRFQHTSTISSWAFFSAKYFGSGVIIGTAFIHLLVPAEEALGNGCLTGPIAEYSWAEGIMLMTIVVMFFLELIAMRYSEFGRGLQLDLEIHRHADCDALRGTGTDESGRSLSVNDDGRSSQFHELHGMIGKSGAATEMYAAQLTSIFVLEFGIIFHSVFIGLTLAVSGSEFTTLYIVIVFHQTFEGLGLGSRLATFPWAGTRRLTPYFLGLAYGFSTPIAIAIGLGVRRSYPPNGQTTLIVNGIFDSISAGILIYIGLVELLAHEFMFTQSMRKAPIRTVLIAFTLLCLGAALMALLGKWA